MPTSLLSVAARLLRTEIDVDLVDENIAPWVPNSSWLGINLLGAPYLGVARHLVERALEAGAPGVLLGGQIVAGLSSPEFGRLYGCSVHNGMLPGELERRLGLRAGALPDPFDISLVGAYRRLPDEHMAAYLHGEVGFFLSQGCRHTCSFCAADRSKRGAPVQERYRQGNVIEQDLCFLLSRAQRTGLSDLRLYLSNLDLFQSPDRLERFAKTAKRSARKYPNVRLKMRGLSNVESFLHVHRCHPEVVEALVEAGLYRVGFGIDGATEAVFQGTRKPHKGQGTVEAIRVASEVYGLVPETLMVFGHVGLDNDDSLSCAFEFALRMKELFDSRPRPHVAKAVVPGNDGWVNRRHLSAVEFLLQTPRAFQMLDFTARPSWLTHPDPDLRFAVDKYYVKTCAIVGATTQYVMPEDPTSRSGSIAAAVSFNEGRYDL